MNFIGKILKAKRAQDRIKVAMELTSFMPACDKETDTSRSAECLLCPTIRQLPRVHVSI
jgi:hypothetical protein